MSKIGQGQSLVEFALVLPVLLIIIVGVFDLGRVFFALITINNAARAGARSYTLNIDVSKAQQAAVSEATNSGIAITTGNVTINCQQYNVYSNTYYAPPCLSGDAVHSVVSYTFTSLLNFLIPAQINLQRSVEMAMP